MQIVDAMLWKPLVWERVQNNIPIFYNKVIDRN